MELTPLALAELSKETIKKGSKSFAMASMLFDPETRASAHFLYSWCRHCDDQIDDARDPIERRRRLEELRAKTDSALKGEPQTEFVFRAFQAVCLKYNIPRQHPFDLLRGMEMDVTKNRYKTFEELEDYCYCVAGVVGVMMSYIMGLSDAGALQNAIAMGNAMQMTNISRDIRTDYNMGRIYLPMAWLEEAGIPSDQLMEEKYRNRVVHLVGRLLDQAEENYRKGDHGLNALPWKAALAVSVARAVYSDIGRIVRARGALAWDSRAYTSTFDKIKALAIGTARILPLLVKRIAHPWQRTSLS